MKISTKGRYGARAMLELALHYGEGPVLVKDIARNQGISAKYLEHIIISLQTAGLVETMRGAKGGCVLARAPSQIKLGEVVRSLEGSIAPVDCVDNSKICPRTRLCVTRDIWIKIKEAVVNVLDSITLEDMVRWQKKKLAGSKTSMYHI